MRTFYLALINKIINVLFDEIAYLYDQIDAIDGVAYVYKQGFDSDKVDDKKKVDQARELCNIIRSMMIKVETRHNNKEEEK